MQYSWEQFMFACGVFFPVKISNFFISQEEVIYENSS